MLSRRNVRVKVMQMLYAMSRDRKLTLNEVIQLYNESVKGSYQLYLFNLLQFIKIAEYAEKDAANRKAKLLPSDEDKRFQPKIFTNSLMQSLAKHSGLNAQFVKYKLLERLEVDNARLIYVEFAKTDEYRKYIIKRESTPEDHLNVLLALYKHCQGSELFNEAMEDNFYHWVDDESLVIGATKKTIKGLPSSEPFYEEYLPDPEATKDFGEQLLRKTHQYDNELLEAITPILKNWDTERVAILDMIMLKMAICELVDFPTIPTKVTLNEFVEISKLYSTDKSKDFINGILDRMIKKLHKEGRIVKEGRGLLE